MSNNPELIDIFYSNVAEKDIADQEAKKLKMHIQDLSPGFAVEISIFWGPGVKKRDLFRDHWVFGVYNQPTRSDACAITITADDDWTKRGLKLSGFYRGDDEAHVLAAEIRKQGERSVDILVHEWLHFFAHKKWAINPDDQSVYSYEGKEHDGEANGWRFWYAALLGVDKPARMIV